MYYTSYFANIRKLDKEKYRFVSITASKPSFCGDDIEDWSFLGPSLKLLKAYKNGEIDENRYTEIYLKYLKENYKNFKDFLILNEQQNVCMLCYEKPSDFCHRHILRGFLNENGIECEEIINVI